MLWTRLLEEISILLEEGLGLLPGWGGRRARAFYYRYRLQRLGRGAVLDPGLEVMAPGQISIGDAFIARRRCVLAAPAGGAITIGDRVSLAPNVVLDAGAQGVITIGNDVGIAHNCVLRSSGHRYDDPERPFKSQGHKPGTIVVEDDVWVAPNSVLLPGAHLERGCIVAPGSVVGGRIKALAIVAGNPARVVGRRGASE